MSCQYHKTVTFNISVSQSSECQTHGTATPPDLPPAIESIISSVSYDNATWHTDFCNKMQVLYHVRYFKLYTYL